MKKLKKYGLICLILFVALSVRTVNAAELVVIDNHTYCVDENNERLVGVQTVDGKKYFFSRATNIYGQMKYGWQNNGKNQFYLDEKTGELQTGLFTYNGKKYYAEPEYGYIQGGVQTVGDKKYFFSRAKNMYGQMKYGWQNDGKHQFYLDTKTGELQIGLFTYNGKKYYAEPEYGYIQGGVQTVGDKKYFFSRAKNMYGQMKYGWQNDGKHQFYLDEKTGKLHTGLFTYKGKEYYAEPNYGYIQGGFQTIDGKIYFFSRAKEMYGVKRTGMLTVGNYKYYLNPNAQIGWFTYNGKEYYSNEKGEIQVGFKTIEDKIYYFSPDKNTYGIKMTGLITAGGKKYYLNPTLQTGWITVNGKTYYANTPNGDFARGFKTIDGEIYFFSNATGQEGVMRTGWIEYSGDFYYFSDEGKAYKDTQTVDGRSYKFNTTTGKVEGFKVVNGKKYYYNPDGTQAKGVQYMMNKFWKFDEIDGSFKKYVREIRVIDISVHNGDIDWNKVKSSGKVDAVILRLGYGTGFIDTKFLANKAELERLGIPYSVYLFSYAENKNEALGESNFVVDTIKNYGVKIASNIFSIYYDLEDWEIKSTGENSYGISQNTYKDMITTFINNTEKKLCIKTRVYASKNYIETRFPSSVQNYATWVAQWSGAITYKGPYEGWQYSNCGSIPGIKGCVDMSKFYY